MSASLVSLLRNVPLRSVRTVERRKRPRCQLHPFLAVSAMVMTRTVKRCVRSRAVDVRCAKGVGQTGLCPTWSGLFSTGCDVSGKKGQTEHRKKLYHGTSAAFVKAIERNGFKVSKDVMFGPGVYTTSDIEKAAIFAAQHETKRCFGVVFCVGRGYWQVQDALRFGMF